MLNGFNSQLQWCSDINSNVLVYNNEILLNNRSVWIGLTLLCGLFRQTNVFTVYFASPVSVRQLFVTQVLSDSCYIWCEIDVHSLWVYLTRCNSISFVQMISAEAPVLFAKAAQIFITELTLRAWIHTEDNKRRTLQVRYTQKMSKHCSCHLISSCFAFYLITCRLILFLPYLLRLSHLSISIMVLALSFFCVFYYLSFKLLSYTLASLGCLFGLLPVSVCVWEQRSHTTIPLADYPSFKFFFSSIDFESKPRLLLLTHFSLWCHFAYSAVPQSNKMDSGMIW